MSDDLVKRLQELADAGKNLTPYRRIMYEAVRRIREQEAMIECLKQQVFAVQCLAAGLQNDANEFDGGLGI